MGTSSIGSATVRGLAAYALHMVGRGTDTAWGGVRS